MKKQKYEFLRVKMSEVEVLPDGDYIINKEILKAKNIQSKVRIKEAGKEEEIAFYLK